MKNLSLPDILKNTEFLKLWGNQALLQVAFNICNYTVLLIIAHRTHSVFAQAQFYAFLTLPALFIGLVAGPVVDFLDRKRIMLTSNLLLGFLFLAYAFADAWIGLILAIAFLTSAVARFFIPSVAATIPLIVEKKNLDYANAFFLFTLMGSVLLGYSITGPILETFGGLGSRGEVVPFFLSSFILFISFFLILKLKEITVLEPKIPRGTIIKKIFHLFWQATLEIKGNKKISLSILLLVFTELIVGILSVALLEYVRRFLQLPLTSVSLIFILPLIVGLIVGALLLSEIEKKYGRRLSIYIACFGIGGLFIILGIMPIILANWLSVLILRIFTIISAFFFGILVVVISVQSRTLLQTQTKIQMQGRVFSFLDILIAISIPIPVLILGFFADRISILAMLIFMGIGVAIATIIGNKIIYRRSLSV